MTLPWVSVLTYSYLTPPNYPIIVQNTTPIKELERLSSIDGALLGARFGRSPLRCGGGWGCVRVETGQVGVDRYAGE